MQNHKIIIFNLLILILILIFSQCLLSQTTPKQVLTEKKTHKDTVCVKIVYHKGDSLVYGVVSRDSIVIDYGTPLIKNRKEKYLVTCDSISTIGHYFMSIMLFEYSATEASGKEQISEEKTHEWLHRKITIEIDSVGNRYLCKPQDTVTAAIGPGGAFQPYLFFPVQQMYKAIDESWIVETKDVLCENGLPLPILRQSSLFRAKQPIDTLNEHCNRLEFIKTGQGSVKLLTSTDSIRVTNVHKAFGTMEISIEKCLPVHFITITDQKLTIQFADGVEKKGFHFIQSDFTLEAWRRGN
jgi:hypothetical protein